MLDTESLMWTLHKSGNKDENNKKDLKRLAGASSLLVPETGNESSQALVFGGRKSWDKFSSDLFTIDVPQKMLGMS